MKSIIRKGVFETNSSSSHSVSICRRVLSELDKFPRNSPRPFVLDEQEIADGGECNLIINKFESEIDKARYMINVIASYIYFKHQYEVLKNMTYDEVINMNQYVWLKELLEDETCTRIVFGNPQDSWYCQEAPFYGLATDDSDNIDEIFACNWEDEKSFKEYIKDIIFNEDIALEDTDCPYGMESALR